MSIKNSSLDYLDYKEPNLMNTIFFWEGFINPELLEEEYPSILEQLKAGEFQSLHLDLKKSAHHRIYSIRLNDSDRLLFTTITSHSKAYLLFLEIVYNHDYQKAKFLKNGVLARYLKCSIKDIEYSLKLQLSLSAEEHQELCSDQGNSTTFRFTPAKVYNNQFIALTDTQEKTSKMPLPLLISGAPGSGKTVVAMSILEQLAQKMQDDETLLYIAASKVLVDKMRGLWSENLHCHPNKKIQFMSYEELLDSLLPSPAVPKVEKEDFIEWATHYLSRAVDVAKACKKEHASQYIASLKLKTEELYQAFRIISGLKSSDDPYFKSIALASTDEERLTLINACTNYCSYLQKEEKINPAFYSLNIKEQFNTIIVDEAQDLSLLQIESLINLAKNKNLCLCMDTHQSLYDHQSKRAYLMSRLGPNTQQIELPGSFRCPKVVSELGNRVLQLKYALTGGLSDKKETPQIYLAEDQSSPEGAVCWLDESSISETEKLIKTIAAGTTDIAIITLPHLVNEVKKRFGTQLVFTPEQIKGLEYHTIVIYKLFDSEFWKEANQAFNEKDIKETIHRPRKETANPKFAPPLNQIFTAITRATNTLIVIEETHHNTCKLLHFLQNKPEHINNKTEHQSLLNTNNYTKANEASWLLEVHKLIKENKLEQARNIYTLTLQKSSEEFNSLLNSNKEPLKSPPSLEKNATETKGTTLVMAAAQSGQLGLILASLKKLNKSKRSILINQKDPNGFTALIHATRAGHYSIVEFLLNNGADIEIQTNRGSTALQHACDKGHAQIANLLLYYCAKLKNKQAINHQDKNGFNALIHAAKNGYLDIIKALLMRGADINATDLDGTTALMIALENNHLDVAVCLLSHYSEIKNIEAINYKDKYGWTSLHLCAAKGHLKCAETLLINGADANTLTLTNATPLIIATEQKHFDVVILLLTHYARTKNLSIINHQDQHGCTALHHAVCKGNFKIVEALLSHGADAHVISNRGETMLMRPIHNNHYQIVTLLLSHYKKTGHENIINHKDILGITALLLAVNKGYVTILEELLDHGAHVNSPLLDGNTELVLAIKTNQPHIVSLLLTHYKKTGKGSVVNQKNNSDWSPLHWATINGHTLFMELLKYGADCDAITIEGYTVLMFAASFGHLETVSYLLDAQNHAPEKRSEYVNKPSKIGWTSLTWAAFKGHTPIVIKLLANGANIDALGEGDDTALMHACAMGHLDVVVVLLNQYHSTQNIHAINQKDKNGWTALMIAASYNHTEIVNALLRYNPDKLSKTNRITHYLKNYSLFSTISEEQGDTLPVRVSLSDLKCHP